MYTMSFKKMLWNALCTWFTFNKFIFGIGFISLISIYKIKIWQYELKESLCLNSER